MLLPTVVKAEMPGVRALRPGAARTVAAFLDSVVCSFRHQFLPFALRSAFLATISAGLNGAGEHASRNRLIRPELRSG
jgi:hypothetical protein